MNRERWFERYYDDVILLNYNDEQRITQAHLKYGRLPEFTIDTSLVSSPSSRKVNVSIDKQRSFTGKKPVIPSVLADTSCNKFTVQELLNQFNTILGTSYTQSTAGVHSILEHCISKGYDFGTAYARLRPFWYGDMTTLVDDSSRREVQYRQMLEDVLVNDRIIYPRVPPRRVWDLYSNRVVPWCIVRQRPWAISHAWVHKSFREDVVTAINGHEWPVPIPKHTSLDRIRIELLNLGAEYVWLDVLCLRQEDRRRTKYEDLRVEEWKVDVSTIGSVYAEAEKVVCYLNGLGLALDMLPSLPLPNWFKRAWTLQEISEHMIIAGDTGNADIRLCAEIEVLKLQRIRGQHRIYNLLSQMRERNSTKPVDKVAGMAYLLHSDSIPAYYGTQSEEDAWSLLVDVAAHQCQWDLLFLYPEPGDGMKSWRPSWSQAMSGPRISRDHDLNLQIGCWDPNGRALADVYFNGYIIASAVVRGLSDTRSDFTTRIGQLIVKDDTKTECGFEITADHQYPIPDGSYTLLGSTTKTSYIYWVVGHTSGNGLQKLSVVRMKGNLNITAVSLMDSFVSRSIAQNVDNTLLA